jgi:hypothetical protein
MDRADAGNGRGVRLFLNPPTKHGATRGWHSRMPKSDISDFGAGGSKPRSGFGEGSVPYRLPPPEIVFASLADFDLPARGRFKRRVDATALLY